MRAQYIRVFFGDTLRGEVESTPKSVAVSPGFQRCLSHNERDASRNAHHLATNGDASRLRSGRVSWPSPLMLCAPAIAQRHGYCFCVAGEEGQAGKCRSVRTAASKRTPSVPSWSVEKGVTFYLSLSLISEAHSVPLGRIGSSGVLCLHDCNLSRYM